MGAPEVVAIATLVREPIQEDVLAPNRNAVIAMITHDDHQNENTGSTDSFRVLLNKKRDTNHMIGLGITHYQGVSFKIQDVKNGLIASWNEKASEDTQVRAGDFIVAVNTIEGNSHDMLKTFMRSDKLDLLIVRGEQAT